LDAFNDIFHQLDRELWLITARAGERSSGLIATYVSKASLVPTLPRVLIGLAKHHFTHELIEASGAFCMHLIDEEHIDWVWRFGIASGRGVNKFHGLEISTAFSGSPIVSGALSWTDCCVEARLNTGDRTVYVAEVLDARAEHAGKPLTFHRLLQLAPAEKLQQLKQMTAYDVKLDRAAIVEWRQRAGRK